MKSNWIVANKTKTSKQRYTLKIHSRKEVSSSAHILMDFPCYFLALLGHAREQTAKISNHSIPLKHRKQYVSHYTLGWYLYFSCLSFATKISPVALCGFLIMAFAFLLSLSRWGYFGGNSNLGGGLRSSSSSVWYHNSEKKKANVVLVSWKSRSSRQVGNTTLPK